MVKTGALWRGVGMHCTVWCLVVTVRVRSWRRAHTTAVSCVEVVTLHGRILLATTSELSVRLWTLQGQFLCVFGQPDIWTHLGLLENAPVVAKKQPKRAAAKPVTRFRDESSVAESLVLEWSTFSVQSVHDTRGLLCASRCTFDDVYSSGR